MPSTVAFTTADTSLLAHYPQKVPFRDNYLREGDKERFQNVRNRLKGLMQNLIDESSTLAPLKPFASHYAQNGRTTTDLWACVFPLAAKNKSYALQVALIVSARGAEVTVCLGAGASTVKDADTRAELAAELQRLRSRLANVPGETRDRVGSQIPQGYTYRRSWRQAPTEGGDFESLGQWLTFAAGHSGAGAAISRNLSATELEAAGEGILEELKSLLRTVTPLFDHCYGSVQDSHELKPGLDDELVDELDADPAEAILSGTSLALDELKTAAADRGLLLDDDVYRAVVAAINSGKHLLLTGPPGTAKTTLAEVIAEVATESAMAAGYLPTTATADWTTYEVIGGLRPADQQTLEFQPGLALTALQQGKWLLIDELNRANFDRAFGQLFTVLSGQSVVLPFEEPSTGKPIALIPEGSVRASSRDQVHILGVPSAWRIVGTMNVFDKSLLFEMSFALMRRFAFVEVASPNEDQFKTLWRRELINLEPADVSSIDDVLEALLSVRTIKDIGPASFIDMARFARHYVEQGAWTRKKLVSQLFFTFLLPQFEGIDRRQGVALFKVLKPHVGTKRHEALRLTLNSVLGLTLAAPRSDADAELESIDASGLDDEADTETV